MNSDEFTRCAQVINGLVADEIRAKYINTFIDTESEWYQKKIATKREFIDGLYYTGYLWECLLSFKTITEEDLWSQLVMITDNAFVLWDLHSSEKILTKDYWLFPKPSVLLISPKDLREGFQHLPEDIYIFTKEYNKTYILTHEYTDSQQRLCAISYSNTMK